MAEDAGKKGFAAVARRGSRGEDRRARDRRYYTALRRRTLAADDEAALRLIALAEEIERERRERQLLENEAVLLGGRLGVRDAVVAGLRARLSEAQRLSSGRSRLRAIVDALADRYGERASSLVTAVERAWPSDAWEGRRLEVLTGLACLPVPLPARNAGYLQERVPFGVLLGLLPRNQHWAGWCMCQICVYYVPHFLLDPDRPMGCVATMLPRDLERIISHPALSAESFGELVRSNSDSNVSVPEARLREWVDLSRAILNVLGRFSSSAQRSSPEYVALVQGSLAPVARFLTSRFLARVAGHNRWIFAAAAPPAWAVDDEACDRLVQRLRLSQGQIDQIVRVYDEMVEAVRALCVEIGYATSAILAAKTEVRRAKGGEGERDGGIWWARKAGEGTRGG